MSNDHPSAAQNWTVLKILQWTTGYLKQRGIENSRSDSEILLSHALNCKRIDLYLNHDQPLQGEELARFKPLVQRRARREPVAYIVGTKEFWSLAFQVTPDVLIPRPETEGLVALALEKGGREGSLEVLELGTGSGIISVALAHERPKWRVWASDISTGALNIANNNACRHLVADRITFLAGHWFDPIGEGRRGFDLIVSNPPYISKGDLAGLAPDILKYEPYQALDGGSDGLSSVRRIIKTAHHHMRPGGWLILEIGYDQGGAVKALGQSISAYDCIGVRKDLAGHDRIVQLRKGGA